MSTSDQIKIQEVSLNLLTPHPYYFSIYGANEDVSDLVELIAERNWVEPLVVTPNYVIVSDHRPWKVCQILGKDCIPVVFRQFPDEIALLKALLLENASRKKTIEQRIKEGMAWESIEKHKAKQRQGRRTDLTNIPETFPECSTGDSRDAIGSRIGLSGRSYSKGRSVVKRIDSLLQEGNEKRAQFLLSVLNKSIDTAQKLIQMSVAEQNAIAQLIEKGKARSTTTAIRMLREQSQPTVQVKTQSCWNCQHRLESIDNQSIYCNKFGILNLIYKSGDERGRECPEWRDRTSPPAPLKNPTCTFQVLLPLEWQDRLEETAASVGMDATTWITNLIGASLYETLDYEDDQESSQESGARIQNEFCASAG
ncbi:ParB/RepB/Spo0J family partition protein [Brasilonema bromeliae]|uniref:ParB-like N-terminal domain-containing protein n=1 Tax=Brasilonema bromeliae SPC951 TaxID=385972 RepID=A0ABX1PF08_9CYAN|nr:ParB/RepB/Spo0J family partition protein [Brasilonema bromeliae]NMG23055.1 hypothetical protein [Brasilonema bromeliae SPC951]